MPRACWLGCLIVLACGCAPATPNLAREYADDAFRQYQCGRFADARESFLAAARADPCDNVLVYNAGQCAERIGDLAGAERLYTECLVRQPANPDCRHALAALYLRQHDNEKAFRIVQDWLAQCPQTADAYAEDGYLWHQVGDLQRAQARLQQALAIDPLNVRALRQLAAVYRDKGRPDLALILYERALRLDPSQADVVSCVNELQQQQATPPAPPAPLPPG
jgi:tetratricopeptide (TPR) repeat protein